MFSVEANNIVKRFGTNTVLRDISFSHSAGVLGIAGPNGSGKTTLLKCLTGLLRPTSGSIRWTGENGELSLQEVKTELGYVAPYINLYHELTVLENLELILRLRNRSVPDETVDRHLGRLQLDEIRHQAFGELSTGQQQRARLACNLIYEPSILFLDEPGANLDEKGTSIIRHIIGEAGKEGKLIILSSNDPEELELADRIISVE